MSAEIVRALATQIPVSDVMTSTVISVKTDMSLETLRALLLERGISGTPVVDDEGHPIGVISKTDLLNEQELAAGTEEHERPARDDALNADLGSGYHIGRESRTTVGEVMMPVAFTVGVHQSLSVAATLMACEGVHRLPVVGSQGEVVGIVSASDVLRWLAHVEAA